MARRLREHLLSLRASRPESQYTERAAKRLKSWLPKLGKSTYEIAVKVINKSPIIINAASSNPGATFGRGQRPEGVKPDLEATARCRKPYASYRRTDDTYQPLNGGPRRRCSLLNCPSGARMRSARHLWKRLTSARADALVATFATAVSLPASLCATQPSSSKAGQVFTHTCRVWHGAGIVPSIATRLTKCRRAALRRALCSVIEYPAEGQNRWAFCSSRQCSHPIHSSQSTTATAAASSIPRVAIRSTGGCAVRTREADPGTGADEGVQRLREERC